LNDVETFVLSTLGLIVSSAQLAGLFRTAPAILRTREA
jgi:hypothetical protein